MRRLDWSIIVPRAAEIVREYDTPVTLRQVFYRLLAAGDIPPEKPSAYKTLSDRTARAREAGEFPDLADHTRTIHRHVAFKNPLDAVERVAEAYRRDRTENQDVSIFLGVEKDGMVAQLQSWFGDLGIPILALKGYSSKTYVDRVADEVESDGRPAVLLYAGDFDASGEDIPRDFVKRTGCFDEIRRVALTLGQIREYGLPENPGKKTDSRAKKFAEKYGTNMQVEMDALPPEVLRNLYQQAIDEFWDKSAYQEALEQGRGEQAELQQIVDELRKAA